MPSEKMETSIASLREQIGSGEMRLRDVVSDMLHRIETGSDLNAFLNVFSDHALARAEKIESKIRDGSAGPLAGAVIAVKDNLALQGERLTCASRILENFIPPYDATVITRLKEADAVIIGKTNMDEFAMGSSNENSAFGTVLNPANTAYVPGGSSGGSAAAVASHMCHAALGSDTGGSIRQPAALCGVYGMKPTYGRVSRYGLVAFASSLDQIGPFANNVSDLARVLSVIAGPDPQDSTCAPEEAPAFHDQLSGSLEGKVVGVPREYVDVELQSEIAAALETAKTTLRSAGARLVDISLPMTEFCIAAYYIICTAEASSNLARYDGARYGTRAERSKDLEDMYVQSRSQGFGAEVKRRIMLGTHVLSSGYYDAYYRRALRVRTLIRRDFEAAFEKCDLLLTPTTPSTAFKLGERTADPLEMYLSDIFTVSANLSGLPALSLPAGVDDAGLPVGLQLIGKPFEEGILLQAAARLEEETRTADG